MTPMSVSFLYRSGSAVDSFHARLAWHANLVELSLSLDFANPLSHFKRPVEEYAFFNR
jgi:hypothetical protein